MGEFLWVFAVEVVLKKALSLGADQIIASRGLKEALEELQKELLHAETILNAIGTNHCYSNDEYVLTKWMKDLQHIVYEAEDILDSFAYEDVERKIRSNKVFPNFSKFVFGSVRLKKINKIIQLLSHHCTKESQLILHHIPIEIESEVRQIRETTSMPENYVVGRKMEVESIVDQVIEASQQELNSILPVYGMGGSGKTTLAKLVFNDERIITHFQQIIWICVSSQPFDINKILQSILQKVHDSDDDRVSVCSKNDRDGLIKKLTKKMRGKRYFLVLDDVWNENKTLWKKLRECLMIITEKSGNSVLVTTRSREIAEMMEEKLGIHRLNKLSDDQCWSIFSHFANANEVPMTSNLEFVREKLVKKIGGLPLLAQILGAAVKFSGDYKKWTMDLKSILVTPIKEESVKFILKLSVDRLPNASIKQCFAYCSNFSKGYKFDKKQLIQMWMAQGFTQPEEGSNETMEDTGERYFNILLSCCLFQDVEDESEIGQKFLMHDLIHDIACHVSNDEKLTSDHSLLSMRKRWTNEDKIVACKVRTVIDMEKNIDNIGDFVHLRVLTFSYEFWDRFPKSISKLKHLRYLDISSCDFIRELPKSIVVLYNLQTLRLPYLVNGLLPINFRHLVSLRHLEFSLEDSDVSPASEMPLYLSELFQLQTLSAFVVGLKKGCKITELGGLRKLKGLLVMLCLEHVESKEEAKSAKLMEKEKVEELHFVWSTESDRTVKNENDFEVLEGLEPHKNLKYLEIESFSGRQFPNQIFVENLVKITILECGNCEKLPMLGQLTNLEILVIFRLRKVESIGNEFYGNHRRSSSVFPKLKEFYVEEMDSLVEWEELTVPKVKAFPRLECLHIISCKKLVKIPDVFGYWDKDDGEKHLKFVEISLCDQLKKLTYGILQSCHSIQHLVLDRGSNLWSFVTTTTRGGPLNHLLFRRPINFFERRHGSFMSKRIRQLQQIRKFRACDSLELLY